VNRPTVEQGDHVPELQQTLIWLASLTALALSAALTGLAAWAAGECWRDGAMFARPRDWLHLRGGFPAELLLCPYCLAHWSAGLLTVGMLAYAVAGCGVTGWLIAAAPVHWLCATRLAVTLLYGLAGVVQSDLAGGLESLAGAPAPPKVDQ
jgi:hypothetical protein